MKKKEELRVYKGGKKLSSLGQEVENPLAPANWLVNFLGSIKIVPPEWYERKILIFGRELARSLNLICTALGRHIVGIWNFALFINDSYAFWRCTQSQQGFNLQHSQQVIKFHENQVADIKRFAYRRLCLPLLHECKVQWWRCQDLFFNHLRCLARVVSCTMNLPTKGTGGYP